MKKINNHVRFKGGFKKKLKDEFPGRDLAEYIADHFRQKDFAVDSVEYTEPWFTVNVLSGSIEYPLMVSHSAMEEDFWEISCPRTLGFFARLRGKSEDAELQSLVDVLDDILQDDETITDVKWFSDYEDLTDDYIKKPATKHLATFGKYLEKVVWPVCATGWVLGLIGGISGGKESILLRIGTIMFLLPFALFFGFIALKFIVALISDIKDSHRKRSKKKWFRWFIYCLIISAMVLPFFLGYFDVIPDWMEPLIERIFWAAMGLLMFCGMLFCLFCIVVSDIQKQKEIKKKAILSIGSILIFFGILGFIGGGFLSSAGVLKWIPASIEFPLAHIGGIDVNKNGNLFVVSSFYSRIQVYNPEGDFIRGWFLDGTGGGLLKIRINDNNKVEVAILRGRKIDIFDENGKLLESRKYDDHDADFFDSFEQKGKQLFDKPRKHYYDVEGLVFPRVIQSGPDGEKKIGKNAFYLFPFQGAFQGWATFVVGLLLIGLAEKKKKRKKK